ncbi:DUF2069 domain-containing protein [Pseudomonas sp. NyZ704]|nr:DUF2069 domain-containing protein [Pseudomonas sp. NyZ704]
MSRADKPLPSIDYLNPRVRLCRVVSLIGYLGLLGTLLIYNAFIADLHGANPWIIIGTLTVPLLIFMPGMLKGNIRTHAWLCFAVNLYFIYGVLTCFQPERMLYGSLLTGFSTLFFIPAMGYVRWGFQAQRVNNGES